MMQKGFMGEDAPVTKRKKKRRGSHPWDGVCSKSCWFATGTRCRCRCGGKHHGTGTRNLEKIRKLDKCMEEPEDE